MIHLTALTLFGLAIILGQGSLPALPVRPNLVLVIVIYAGQFYAPIPGLLISFVLGYFLDLMSGGLLGFNAFSMVSICYLAFTFSRRIAIQNLFPQLLTIFTFYMVYGLITFLLFRFFNFDVTNYSHLRTTLADALVATVLAIFIILAIRKMEKLFRFENNRSQGPGDLMV